MQWETDKEKPYRSLSQELKDIYGGKVYKLSLSSFCTCPNRDGSLGFGGCIFCSAGGSGEFAQASEADIDTQIERAKELVAGKLKKKPAGYIAYFQSFSNTYGDPERLKELFLRAMEPEDVLILSVATRPDCLPDEILDMLSELARIKPVWVELGLQTVDEKVAEFINRGYKLPVFEEGVRSLKEAGIGVVVHVIAGLPAEGEEEFRITYSFLKDHGFAALHVFPFSPRPGTELYGARDRCEERVRDERAARLRKLSDELGAAYQARQTGRTLEVLLESRRNGLWRGTTGNYLKVEVEEAPAFCTRGQIISGVLTAPGRLSALR